MPLNTERRPADRGCAANRSGSASFSTSWQVRIVAIRGFFRLKEKPAESFRASGSKGLVGRSAAKVILPQSRKTCRTGSETDRPAPTRMLDGGLPPAAQPAFTVARCPDRRHATPSARSLRNETAPPTGGGGSGRRGLGTALPSEEGEEALTSRKCLIPACEGAWCPPSAGRCPTRPAAAP